MKSDRFTHNLAVLCLILCFVYFFYISLMHYDASKNNNVGEIKTAMISFVTMILGYFFGSSRGSQQKDDNINQLINKNEKEANGIPKMDNPPPPPERQRPSTDERHG